MSRPGPVSAALLALFGSMLPAAAAPQAGHPGVSAPSVPYEGEITAERNQRLFDSVGDRAVERLVIRSPGGDVEAGIALGRWVFERGLDVEVSGRCLSSCANYVFPAGKRKIIRPGAVVAWHGSYTHLDETGQWTGDIAYRMETYGEDEATARRRARAEVERLVALERAFFRDIGVDGYLCWIGKMPPFEAPDYYFLSAEDMARFGVTRVRTPPGYEDTDGASLGLDLQGVDLGPSP